MSIKKAIKLEDSTRLSLPASVYTEKDYIKGEEPFGVLYVDKNGQWHLSVSGESTRNIETKGVIVLE